MTAIVENTKKKADQMTDEDYLQLNLERYRLEAEEELEYINMQFIEERNLREEAGRITAYILKITEQFIRTPVKKRTLP